MALRPLAVLALAVGVIAPATPASAADGFTCEASAVRGSLLGTPAFEPLVANRGLPCQDALRSSGAVLAAASFPISVVGGAAQTTLEGPVDRVDLQRAGAVGGLSDLRVKALPALPVQLPSLTTPQQAPVTIAVPQLPLPQVPPLPPIQLPPLSVTLDINQALRALIPQNRLPDADLLRVGTAVAYAGASCQDGRPRLAGASDVTGVSVLGQELAVNELVEKALTLDTGSIDPSNLNIASLAGQLPLGVTLTPAVTALIQGALDALPPIALPANLASVKVTPGAQERTADALAQQALRLQVSVAGQQLADLLVGEAKVGSASATCSRAAAVTTTAPPDTVATNQAVLQCTTRRLVLTDVLRHGDRVRIVGAADRDLAGKRVSIRFTATGRQAASAVVSHNGGFSTTAPLPSRHLRSTNAARYQAVLGKERSLKLKLVRRMVVQSVRSAGGKVTIRGRVSRPLGTPARSIAVVRRVSCKHSVVVKRVRPRHDGTFSVTVEAPPKTQAAVYRLGTQVRKNARNPKLFPTFTLPRAVEVL